MKPARYLTALRRNWLIVVLFVAVGVAVAAVIVVVRPASYTATVPLYVSAQSEQGPQQAFQGAQLSEQRVKSYEVLVTSSRVLAEVAARLNLSESPTELANSVTVQTAIDSVIMEISARSSSAQNAADLANMVGTVTIEVVNELERPEGISRPAPVQVRVIQPAIPPATESTVPDAALLAIGFLLGCILGVAGAVARSAIDTRVLDVDSLTTSLRAPAIGVVTHSAELDNTRTVLGENVSSRSFEEFRRIRTNLQYIGVDQQRKVIVVASANPGEGKSTTAANTAYAVALTGLRVLLIDGDIRSPSVSRHLGIDPTVGLTKVLSGQITLASAIQSWRGGTFDVLAAGPRPPNPGELLASRQMSAVIRDLRGRYDLVVIDTAPVLAVADAVALVPHTDGAIVVCRYEKTTRSNLNAVRQSFEAVNAQILGTVLNHAPRNVVPDYSDYGQYGDAERAASDRGVQNGSGYTTSQNAREKRSDTRSSAE